MPKLHPLMSLSVPDALYSAPTADEIRGLINRARILLRARTSAQIDAAEDGLDTIFSDDLATLEEAAFAANDGGEAADRKLFRHSAPRLLKVQINRIDIRGQKDFPAALWSEYFAVLALRRLQGALRSAQQHYESTRDGTLSAQKERLANSMLALLDSQEAVTIAELIAIEDKLQMAIRSDAKRDMRSLNALRAAKQRRAPLNALKKEMIAFYVADPEQPVAAAVRAFLKGVSRDRLRECEINQPERVLTETLYAFRKGRLKDPSLLPTDNQMPNA